MSDWTFGAVKARNMEIVALCERRAAAISSLRPRPAHRGHRRGLQGRRHPAHGLPRLRRRPLAIRLSFAEPLPRAKTNVALQEDRQIVQGFAARR